MSEEKKITTNYPVPVISISNVNLEKVRPAEYLATMSNNLLKFLSEINKSFETVNFHTEGTEELVDRATNKTESKFMINLTSKDKKYKCEFITCIFRHDTLTRNNDTLYDIELTSCEPLPVTILPYWTRMKLLREFRNIIFKEINNMIVY